MLTECLKVYERGVELFTFPVAYEIWNIYLSKFVKRYVSATLSFSAKIVLKLFTGRKQAGAGSGLVRTSIGEMPFKTGQTTILDVRKT